MKPSALGPLLGLLLGLLLGACKVANLDHCVHRDIDSDAWCEKHVPGTRYCSPCAEEQHGCVADPPADDCPAYRPDGYSSGVVSDAGGPLDEGEVAGPETGV